MVCYMRVLAKTLGGPSSLGTGLPRVNLSWPELKTTGPRTGSNREGAYGECSVGASLLVMQF